jgi:uncharacterized protein
MTLRGIRRGKKAAVEGKRGRRNERRRAVVIESLHQIEGRRILPGEAIQFHCRPELPCFNSCCRGKRLPLLPYDVLRLRLALNIPSDRLLADHGELEEDPASGWPVLRLKLEADGRCPFVTDMGCAVYPHRPTCCRIFPLARAVSSRPGESTPEEIFLATEAKGCLGWSQHRTLTVEQWVAEQGLVEYRRANNRVSRLFLHPLRRRPLVLSPRETHTVIMALYNLDVLRRAVEPPDFAARGNFPRARIDRALASDEDLLELGEEWLTTQLFG